MDEALTTFLTDVSDHGGRALLVGGAVRDHLLGLPMKDLDVEVFGIDPLQLKSICRRHGHVMLVGAAFAVLKVTLANGQTIDVSVPRREIQEGCSHTSFSVQADPSMSFMEAASRRDLTINAISYDPLNGDIIDPFDGRSDLHQGILRHVGPRFREDPLRVLRIVQFSARFGFEIHEGTRVLCREMVGEGLLATLPRERIGEEIRKLLTRGRPDAIVQAMRFARDTGILRALFPELADLSGIQQDPRFHSEGDAFEHTALALSRFLDIAGRDALSDDQRWYLGLSVLCHDLGKATTTSIDPDGSIRSYGHDAAGTERATNLLGRITNHTRTLELVTALTSHHMRPMQLAAADHVSDAAIRRLAKSIEPASIADLACLVEADSRASLRPDGSTADDGLRFLLDRANTLGVTHHPAPPVFQGRDLIRLARTNRIDAVFLRGGPHFSEPLEAVYNAQIEGMVHDTDSADLWILDWFLRKATNAGDGNS